MEIVRTPEERFAGLPEWGYSPKYVEVEAGDGSGAKLRVAYVDEGPREAQVVLMLHGEPSWGFLYRKVVKVVLAAGLRAVVPDLVGFGRSDKPVERAAYTYARHVAWMSEWVRAVDVRDVTLLCQDWGGLIGLRLVADAELGSRFERVVAANTFLPTGDMRPGEAFFAWRKFSQETPVFDMGSIVAKGTARGLSEDVVRAYDAPFPDDRYKAGARMFPMLVPAEPDNAESAANRAAWERLKGWQRPFLTAFGDSDKITRGADMMLQALIPGCRGQKHVTLQNAGHFLQEDVGEELGRVVVDFVRGG